MLRAVMALAACVLTTAPAVAQGDATSYPTRPIRIIVSFGPGGGADIVSRIFAQSLQEKLGQPVVIENKPGAAGTIGNEAVARAEKDGYTLGIMTAGQIIAAVINKSVRYDTATAFEPISLVATASLIMVTRPDFPAHDVAALITAAKANPGKINVASPGFGATQHLAAELFRQTAGIETTSVQFRTSPEAITALLGKQVDVLFDTVLAVLGQIQSKQLRAIAVTSKERFPIVPDVPPAIESGLVPGYDVTTWYGFFAPRGTPPAIIAKLNTALNAAIKEDAVREKLIKAGVTVQGSTPEEFGKFMATELARWDKVRQAAGIEKQ
jgi:tripartite-type tricarboxylate transporter receptor subunit TctC